MQTRRRELFTTIRSEGAILPPDLLQRIADGARDLDGLTPPSYHLAANERLNEAINRSWNRLVGAWTSFREASERLPESDLGTTLTRERWLQILFQELGYGRLQTARAVEVDGRAYPVSHAWGQTPIHLVGFRVALDRRSAGVAGAATHSPHGLLQELLNRSDERLWGFVSNGLALRVLRDNSSLTRQAFVEFDVEGMMEDEVYSDFVVLWLLCHQSRVEGERPEESWLERWSQMAVEQGTRALDGLRAGVEEAIAALGSGFLAHPANGILRDALRSGDLPVQDFYRQILRLVYRLLFLFVAEDRELLLDPAADQVARDRYERFYSSRRLRQLAERRRGGKHHDLYEALKLVARKLGDDDGCRQLGLPALGSFLWSSDATPRLDDALLRNTDLLDAIRALAFVHDRGVRRAVDYRNLGSEELGSVYESLLELHPELNVDAASFSLTTAGGHERKTTGSYYTPTSLINLLLDSALAPVLEEAARSDDAEASILSLTVCDPACGSGHFLVAAAHRIAKRLASVRTGDDEPAPEAVRTALRDVVGRCLYGVDVNPMAVELCKVALWLEGIEPGRPLSFLDAHIKQGNSLLGVTAELLAAGIPDDAFKPLVGDDRDVVSGLRRRNRTEREGQLSLEDELAELEHTLAVGAAALETAPDESIADLHRKEARFRELIASDDYARAKLLGDAWCSAFVNEKRSDDPPITQTVLRRLATSAEPPVDVRGRIAQLASHYAFFHWEIEFPAVFGGDRAGFNCVLGNPPWERVKLQEKEFFAGRHPEIAAARTKAVRARLIERLEEDDPPLYEAFQSALRQAEGESHLLRDTARYPLAGRGDVNTYAVFAELMRSIIAKDGRVGCIVPTGIATDDTTKWFFRDLAENHSLVSLFDFRNQDRFFYDVGHRRFKFCLLTMAGGAGISADPEFVFTAEDPQHVHDPDRRFSLAPEDFELLNPNTGTCPVFRSRRDADLVRAVYRRVPVLINRSAPVTADTWKSMFVRLFDMANDSGIFKGAHELDGEGYDLSGNVFARGSSRYVPLYEAKMAHQFDHRYGDYAMRPEGSEDTQLPDVPVAKLDDPDYAPMPRHWVPAPEVEARLEDKWPHEWFIGWRDITNSTNERAIIAAALPRVGVGHVFPLFFGTDDSLPRACLLANLNSFSLDYVCRQKLSGTHLTYFILEQLPVLPPERYEDAAPWSPTTSLRDWVTARVLELVYTAWDLEPFAHDHGCTTAPFHWNPERRALLKAELDACFFHLYGLARDDVEYVMETFPIVRRNDERLHGEFRTKRLILERFDGLAASSASGAAYETVLDPPPADSRAAHRAVERAAAFADADVIPLPFLRVDEPSAGERYRTAVPIFSLKAAAGSFGRAEEIEADGWAKLERERNLRDGMFVAEVVGRSMEPQVPNGAWCLFRTPVEGSRDGKIVLVQHRAIDDPDTGGSYTVKRYRSRKAEFEDQLWKHEEIILEPLNPSYDPIVLSAEENGDVRVIAELVEVLG